MYPTTTECNVHTCEMGLRMNVYGYIRVLHTEILHDLPLTLYSCGITPFNPTN
jgi:hypothetical protein